MSEKILIKNAPRGVFPCVFSCDFLPTGRPCAGMHADAKVPAMGMIGRIGTIVAMSLLSLALLAPRPVSAVPNPGDAQIAPGSTSLAGELLIAAPSMADPRFA